MNLAISSPFGAAAHSLASLFLWRARSDSRPQQAALTPANTQTLQKGALLVVLDPLQHRVECLGGSVWITHDGDIKDIILDAGQNYQAERNSRMVIYALTGASLRLGRRTR